MRTEPKTQQTEVLPDYNAGHASGHKIADDVRFLPTKSAIDVPGASTSSSLSVHEAKFFKANGYLIKRGLLADAQDAFTMTTAHFWNGVPGHALTPDDPEGWLDKPGSHWSEQDHANVGTLMGTNWKMRSRGETGVGTEPFLVDRLANNPKMLDIAGEFLGAAIKPVKRVRGIYGVFPLPEGGDDRLHPHGDYMASQLSAMVLVADVPTRCGGFTIWPGSHTRLHLSWDRVNGSTITGERVERYPRERDQALRDINPVEFSGKAGDVIFWHPRMIHSAGVNYSATTNHPMVRILVPIDYQRADQTYIDDLEYGPGPLYQFWVDTRNVAEDVPSTPDNMWTEWGIG